ncbi:YhgE/Pip domain-containing protein [Actinomyces minihominis]|uniref:YhgE/Pip domain-containing protein n=1 Tax=Actinomyces minihominis TaxID=2002838 RepID=UPI000C06D75C|nr:YhgE/Pip domain-containing protein [Actinomyces minihominis]
MSKVPTSEKPKVVGRPKMTGSTLANLLVVVAIIFIPLMYGGVLTSAYQDPVGRINHIQAAVVNEDTPYQAQLVSGETETVDVGAMLTDALVNPAEGEDTGFTWHAMTAQEAEKDILDESIRAILYIPADLSQQVAQIGTAEAAQTIPSQIRLVTDDGINYLSGTLAMTVAATLEDRITSEASATYAEALLGSLGTIRTGMGTAADGATQLTDGSTTLASGLTQLNEGAASAATGSNTLSDGADQLAAGLNQMADQVPALQEGVSALDSGTAQLAGGASSLNSGLNQYTSGVDQVAAGASTLRSQTPELAQGIAELQDGSAQVAAGNKQLDETFKKISEPIAGLAPIPGEIRDLLTGLSGNIAGLYEKCVAQNGASDPLCLLVEQLTTHQDEILGKIDDITANADEAIAGVAAAQDAMDQLADGSEQVSQGLTNLKSSVGSTSDTATNKTVLGAINSIDDGLTTLAGNSQSLRSGAEQLLAGSQALKDGTGTLSSKVPTLVDGVTQLDSGAGELASGATELSTGLGTLAEGISTAADGSKSLVQGSEQLRDGLVEGEAQIPNYSSSEANEIAATSSNLLEITPVRDHEVAGTGAGFSPMFLSLALWVGGIAIFLVLPALDRRPGPGETWWMAAARPAATASIFAVAQATLAVVLTNLLVELHAAQIWGMIGIAVLASLTFVAINQAFIATMGYRGRFVSIVLLLLQIASMGATFPIETMPRFFNWIHPLLPMTYTQLSFRAMIAGSGRPGIIGATVVVLLIWMAVAVALILLGAYLRERNHPLPYDAALLPDNYPNEDEVGAATLAQRRDIKKELVEFARARLAWIDSRGAGHASLGTLGPRSTSEENSEDDPAVEPADVVEETKEIEEVEEPSKEEATTPSAKQS